MYFLEPSIIFFSFLLPLLILKCILCSVPFGVKTEQRPWASLFSSASTCQHIQHISDWTALFLYKSKPRHTKQRVNEKKKKKKRKREGEGEREESKISSWLPPTITNSSFPLRRHCKHSWNRTLSCGQEEREKTSKPILIVSDKSDQRFHRYQWGQQQQVCQYSTAEGLGRRGGRKSDMRHLLCRT